MKPPQVWLFIIILALVKFSFAGDKIPEAAWHRPIGLPLENPGGKKPEIKDMIDDGYWQGAPVGGYRYAGVPATFFAENGGGVCRIAPRKRVSSGSSWSRVKRGSTAAEIATPSRS